MKKAITCGLVLVLALASCSVCKARADAVVQPPVMVCSEQQNIGEMYRGGLNPAVVEAIERFVQESRKFRTVTVLHEDKAESWEERYSSRELEILALIIYQEAGGDTCSDETRLMVGNVFMNRVAHPDYPDGFEEVALEKGQYGSLYWTGLEWPARASMYGERAAVERAYCIAERVLSGERVLPEDVIFQSEYIMGEIVAQGDGMYFCR